MPSYEASHEFDKRGHRHHQPIPAAIGAPTRPAGPSQPPGANPPFNNRHPQDRRRGGSRPERRNGPGPPGGPTGHGSYGVPPQHVNVNFPPHPPFDGPMTYYPGPGRHHGGPDFMPGPLLPPPEQLYGPGGIPPGPPPGVNPYGPPAPYHVGRAPFPPHHPYGQHLQGYGQPPVIGTHPGSQPPGHPQPHSRINYNHQYNSGSRGRWDYGQRNRYNSSNVLPKPPPGLPIKPVTAIGSQLRDGENGGRGPSTGDGQEESTDYENGELNYG